VPIYNPDSIRAPKVLTQTLARWLGRAATTVRAWVRRGILPQPERRGQKTVVHDVAAVLLALSHRIPFGAGGDSERKGGSAACLPGQGSEAAVAPAVEDLGRPEDDDAPPLAGGAAMPAVEAAAGMTDDQPPAPPPAERGALLCDAGNGR
jgi:hypothetical protein